MNIWDNLDFVSRCFVLFRCMGNLWRMVFFVWGEVPSWIPDWDPENQLRNGVWLSQKFSVAWCNLCCFADSPCIRESSMSPCFARWMRHAVSTFASAIAVAWVYKHLLLGSSTFFCLCNICNSFSPVHWGIHTKLCITCLQSIRQ